MKAILDNPYRIAGLLAGTTAIKADRHITRLKMFVQAGLDPPQDDDYSFPVFGEFTRTIELIEQAASKLAFDSDKMNAALFWFWKENEITDRAALHVLKDSDKDMASQLWDNLINSNSWEIITDENYSAFHNYFVVEMLRENGNLTKAITRNLYFLESDLSARFVSSVIDEFFKITAKELQINFLNVIQQEIDQKTINLTFGKLITILKNTTFIAKEDFFKNISQKIVSKIKTRIETAHRKRTTDKVNAANAGETLFRQTGPDLAHLKFIVGIEDFTYSNIADKIANEILQCGIDYFNDCEEKKSENNYHERVETLLKYAKQIAIGPIIVAKVEKNISTLAEILRHKGQEYIDKILALCDDPMIINLESKFRISYSSREMIAKAKKIITLAKPDLLCIKDNNDRYLGISTRVASDTYHLIKAGVDQIQEKLDASSETEIIKSALEVTELIDTLDLPDGGVLSEYQDYKKTLRDRLEKLEIESVKANNQNENINAILNNPYRILGLLAGAKAPEINIQANRLKAGQKLGNDYSFPVLGKLQRTPANIDAAVAKLDLDAGKMNAALFWFWNGDPITDEVAFSALKDGNKIYAMDKWTERTYGKEVTESNISAFQNFSTLLLLMNDYEHGINLKLNLLGSDFITDFITAVTGRIGTVTPNELKSSFLNFLRNELGFNDDKIADYELSAKQDLLRIRSQQITNNITSNIDKAKKERTKNKDSAAQTGKILFKNVKDDLEKLKSKVGIQNIIYVEIADSSANEILNCANDYFDFWEKTNIFELDDYIQTSDIIKLAKKISVGEIVKNKIDESSKIFNNHIDVHDTEINNKIKNIENEMNQIKNEIKELEDKIKTINNTVFYDTEIKTAKNEMEKIKSFHLFRAHSIRENEITKQQHIIKELENKAKEEKQKQIIEINCNIQELKRQMEQKKQQQSDSQTVINNLKIKIQNAEN